MTTASILITGVRGFSGQPLLAVLEEQGETSILGVGQSLFGPGRRYLPLDLGDTKKVQELLQLVQPEKIFHLVGQIRGEETPDLIRVNVLTTVNILEGASRTCPHCKILIIGSAAEYGYQPSLTVIPESSPCLPIGSYGLSKKLQTDIALHFHRVRGLRVIVARPFNLLGPNLPSGLVARDLTKRIQQLSPQEKILPVQGSGSVRDFLDVRDAVRAYIQLLESGEPGKVYNVCSGVGRTIEEVAKALLPFAGLEGRVTVVPTGEIPADRYVGDPGLIQRTLPWRPRYTFEESLEAVYTSTPFH